MRAAERLLARHIAGWRVVFVYDGDCVKLAPGQVELAARFQVAPQIHVDDYTFRFLCRTFGGNAAVAYAHYMADGRVSAEKIRSLVTAHMAVDATGHHIASPLRMLDVSAGYGSSARHLKHLFPGVALRVLDAHRNAEAFNRDILGLDAGSFSLDPGSVNAAAQYDVVSALSLFAHLPRAAQGPWLAKLMQCVRPGGILIFTAHGETAHRLHLSHLAVDPDGFGFEPVPEQFDGAIVSGGLAYGRAVTYRSFVTALVRAHSDFTEIDMRPDYWWGHQDAYVLRKAGG